MNIYIKAHKLIGGSKFRKTTDINSGPFVYEEPIDGLINMEEDGLDEAFDVVGDIVDCRELVDVPENRMRQFDKYCAFPIEDYCRIMYDNINDVTYGFYIVKEDGNLLEGSGYGSSVDELIEENKLFDYSIY
nr:MAG TPA: hypothetical protein [Caudoviricetes sp.]